MERILLIGAEEVSSAARTISSAADQMANINRWNSEEMSTHRAFMNDWLDRFEQILKDNAESITKRTL